MLLTVMMTKNVVHTTMSNLRAVPYRNFVVHQLELYYRKEKRKCGVRAKHKT